MRIWVLDDAVVSQKRIPWYLRQLLPQAQVRVFDCWLKLEAAWQTEERPVGIILDLLVPHKNLMLVRFLLGYNRAFSWVGSILKMLIRPWIPSYIAGLRSNLMSGSTDFWGGVDFLRTRAIQNDLGSTRVYVYSITVNEQYRKIDDVFDPVCNIVIDEYLKKNIVPHLKQRVKFFAKGYFTGPFRSKIVFDSLEDLIVQMREDLMIK